MILPGINWGAIERDCSGDFNEWSIDDVNYVTQQGNGCDCGVFTWILALSLSVERPLYFDKKFINGQEFRNRIGFSILREGLGDIFEWI